jgi:DNA mismatch repair protein MutS
MLLFGTNAVGKTSFMKAVGIAVIMAQSGLFVACDKMLFSPYNQMFTRILNNDNMFKGLSTFAVEMSELRVILKMADKNSIVLGDELCSGTEYESASSIFVSGIQWLESKKATFIFASHLHNITTFKEIENLKNITCNHMSVFYDIHNDCLVYDRILKDGSGDSVYGLEVCKSLHLPNDFLENAYLIRNKYFKQNKNNFLLQKQSRYNSKKVILKCEICCINPGTETHHLIPQRNANKDNFIDHYHKNHIANLSSICEECHNKIHAENYELKKVKTTKGYSFSLINNS